jgi:hypothetical protein
VEWDHAFARSSVMRVAPEDASSGWTSLRTLSTFPSLAKLSKLAGPGRTSSSHPSRPLQAPSPSPGNRVPPTPRLGRRHPKVNFWGPLEFRQAVKLNSRTRKRFNKEGL